MLLATSMRCSAGRTRADLHNPDFVKFAESFGAVGMRADDPLELETLIPLALERVRLP